MASTVILMLDRRQAKKGGLYPISIVINFKGSRSYINLKRSVHPDFWDQETCRVLKGAKVSPKLEVPQVNIYIQGKLTDAQRIVGGLEQTGEIDQLSHSELRTRIVNKSPKASFSKYLDGIVSEYKENGNAGQARIYGSIKKFLVRYSDGDKDYKFEDINYKLLKKVELKFKPKVDGSKNGLSIYLRTIRAVWNRAIKEGLVKKEKYPFIDYQIKKSKTHKTAIKGEAMRKIMELELPIGTPAWHGRNMFMFSFYTRGMNFADVAKLRVKNITDGRITYLRSKTKKIISIKLDVDINNILSHYLTDKVPDDYVFPIITDETKATEQILAYHGVINHALKRWAKKLNLDSSLSFNTARHTWATMGKDANLPIAVLSEGLGHADIGTTQIYLDSFDNDLIDAAAAMVKF
jgi:integrase